MASISAKNSLKPLTAHRSGPLQGIVKVPGDKSISHRALMLGALSIGRTRIEGLLEADDVLNTARIVTAMGAKAFKSGIGWDVVGRGIGGLSQPRDSLDFGNAGTGTRLMMGIIAGHDMTARLTGDASLHKRPMGRALVPLRKMGLEVLDADRDRLPLTLRGSSDLVPIDYSLPVPSAQVKSAVLLAGLHAAGATTVIEPEATRDHTERMIRHFGGRVDVIEKAGARHITVYGDAELQGRLVTVPGDPSSAAFLVAAALTVPGSDITVTGILTNPTRAGFFVTLKAMGADLNFENERSEGGETVADIRARHSPRLKGVRVPASRAPSMIDEYPILSVVAAFADGETRMDGLAELKAKESDRLAGTASGLLANGVATKIAGDTLTVSGSTRVKGGGRVATQMDHRLAMAFLVLGLASDRPVTVDDTAMIATSFPEFLPLLRGLGATFGEA